MSEILLRLWDKKRKLKETKLTNLLDPNAANGSLLDELGVGKLLVNALEFPETNPEELKLLKGSKAAYKINKYKT